MQYIATEALQELRNHKLLGDKGGDNRSRSQRDRDRILYSTAFRRLGAVTQVVLARDDGHLFHNRLTHSLKVAQLGRRLAEKFVSAANGEQVPSMSTGADVVKKVLEARGGLDPEVVEAACLAHDLGHPPFGHLAEKELHRLASMDGVTDGFEGNAQTFRILTRLSLTRTGIEGLNLTVATLNAVSKYPWQWQDRSPGEKWGAFNDDHDNLDTARAKLAEAGVKLGPRQRTIEAEIMDWADDITYAVHDLEDFLRAGFIPLERLAHNAVEAQEATSVAEEDWWPETMGSKPSARIWSKASRILFSELRPPLDKPFRGTASERARIRFYMSGLIHRFVDDTTIAEDGLHRTEETVAAVAILKALTKIYVHKSPALATQQHGQRRVICNLYRAYMRALQRGDADIFPARLVEDAAAVAVKGAKHEDRVRLVVDCIASMTEARAFSTHHRLMGIDSGQLIEPPN